MNTIKISKSELVGDIENFPIEVVTKMVEYQIEQGGTANVTVFAINKAASALGGGFSWDFTEEGFDFWFDIIHEGNFEKFFEKFPKLEEEKSKFVYIVGDIEYGDVVIAELERRGAINKHRYSGDNNEWLYYIDPTTNIIEYCDTDEVLDNKLYDMLMTFYSPIEIEIVEEKVVEEEDKTVEVSMEEIAKMMGVEVSNLRIKE